MTTRAVLTFENTNGKQEIRFFKTAAEAKAAITNLRTLNPGQFEVIIGIRQKYYQTYNFNLILFSHQTPKDVPILTINLKVITY